MEANYRVILQLNGAEGFTFKLWDKGRKIFTDWPKPGTKIPEKSVFEETETAKKSAGGIFGPSKTEFFIRFERWPEKFEEITPKGF